jgi:hypothetical protein
MPNPHGTRHPPGFGERAISRLEAESLLRYIAKHEGKTRTFRGQPPRVQSAARDYAYAILSGKAVCRRFYERRHGAPRTAITEMLRRIRLARERRARL